MKVHMQWPTSSSTSSWTKAPKIAPLFAAHDGRSPRRAHENASRYSLRQASSFVIGRACDLHDLDGPLLFEHDRPHGMKYSGGVVSPPCPDLWG